MHKQVDWRNHKPSCKESTSSQQAYLDMKPPTRAYNAGSTTCVPMENISPLLQEFVTTYRPLMIFAMTNAFGYTAPHTPHASGGPSCFCEASPIKMVLFINLRAAPKLSITTKGRAAFRIESAETLTLDALRAASKNRRHRLYDQDNLKLLESFDRHAEMMDSIQLSTMSRHSMCFMKLHFTNDTGSSIFLKNFFYSDDKSSDYSSRWNPDDWLEYLKQEVAKGKGWEPRY
ncbi:hypothetical protein HWV62_14338 [Athelia sp. TMB]|nr:hypothetical protein HWV62_14338 [Athelia sp. TMB]